MASCLGNSRKDCSGTRSNITMTSRKQLFSVRYFQHSRRLFRIKEDGKISNAALDCQNCKDPINCIQDNIQLISEPGSVKKRKAAASCSRVKGHRYSSDSSLMFPCKGSGGEGKEGSVITVEKVSSWRFCYDPADSPIP